MADMSNATAKALSCGQELHGFVITDVQDLPEIDGRAVLMRHQATGAPLMWLANDDANKSFSITFKTPPRDSTGVFHILEHSVLCGSDLYPVKEPFVNLLKSSMQTFLNALTFSDKTMYPVASTNERDLLNLMSVYLDAVFFPQLYSKRAIFEQEGWHYEVEGEGDERRLVTNGVVLNEMRGAMSDPDEVALAGLNEALFPDNAYGFESGGNPDVIPTLTYEDYLDTHARHYNMANSRIVLYGDMALHDELELIDGFARRAQGRNPGAGLPNPLTVQTPCVNLQATRTMRTSPDNACVMLGYVVGTYRDRQRLLACDILSDALMGSNEAPLKKKILESDLGCDVDCFVFDGLQQPYVAFELRGAQPGCAAQFEQLVESELARMAEEGIPRPELGAALDACDFNLRERDSGMADGVALAVNAMCGWLYDDDMPCDYLRYEDAMAALRAGLEGTYWEDLVRDVFVTSAHHACCELIALDDDDDAAQADGFGDDVEAGTHAEADLDEVERAAERLRRIQDAPDSPQALATLPRLGVEDVQDAPHEHPWQAVQDAPLPCMHYELETRRIDYTYHYFPLDALTWEELPLVSLACSLLGKLQTTDYSAAQLDLLVESRLGRLTFSTHVGSDAVTGALQAHLLVGACAISENLADLAGLPAHIWGKTDFSDTDKIRTILQQQKLDSEQSFASSGHFYALARAFGYTDARRRLAQHFGGVDYYRFVCDLLARWDEVSQTLPARLADVCDRVFRRGGDHHSFTGSASDMSRYWDLAQTMGLSTREQQARLVVPADAGLNEAFIVPADVCFVAKAASGAMAHNTFSGAWNVAQKAVNYEYLWNEIRVKGGAYGCGLRCDVRGELGYYTYRDPNLDASLRRMDATADWLRSYAPTRQDMEGYIVSTVAAHDAPKRPYQVARRNDTLFLAGRTLEWRDQLRREELACTAQTLRTLAPALQATADQGRVCVFGSKDILSASQADLEVIDLIAR